LIGPEVLAKQEVRLPLRAVVLDHLNVEVLPVALAEVAPVVLTATVLVALHRETFG